jgi:Mg2+ and Co2+ transporter CorA
MLPALFSRPDYSLFENLVEFCQHQWHLGFLFQRPWIDNGNSQDRPAGSSPHVLVYLLNVALWRTNLRHLDQQIKHISFNELREPNIGVNSRLHDYREDLFYLRDHVSRAKDGLPKDLDSWFSTFTTRQLDYLTDFMPGKTFARLLDDAEALSQFLMDSFQLLISSVSTQDAQTSLEQGKRGARLTQLAFIYVPLSFVTGIFGMNMKELNGSTLRLWVSVATLAVVIACTVGIFWALKLREKRRYRKGKMTSVA